jgi:hypothetical protein
MLVCKNEIMPGVDFEKLDLSNTDIFIAHVYLHLVFMRIFTFNEDPYGV